MSAHRTPPFRTPLLLLAFASVLWRVFTHFDPATVPMTPWNSDAAIPVLQANDPVFDVFRLYYYGQDRIGAWPWLLAQGARALTGMAWTPYRMFLWQATCTLLALPLLLRLHRAAGPLLAATYAALALLSPLFQVQLFGLSQPFGWQLTVLLLAWWALARLTSELGAAQLQRRAAAGWGALAAAGCVLACWTSPTSGPLLLVGGVLAALPAWLARPGVRRRLLLALAPLALGIVFEALVRHVYHRFARARFGSATTTKIQLDLGHLADNARGVGLVLREHPLLPLLALGLALGALALVLLLRAWRRGELAGSAAPSDATSGERKGASSDAASSERSAAPSDAASGERSGDLPGALPSALDVPLATLTAGLALAALANAVINVLVRHVRLNGYDVRYLVPTFALGALAAAAGAVLLMSRLRGLRAPSRLAAACALLSAGVLGAAHAAVRPREPEPLLGQAQAAVDAVLARRPAGLPLLGGYWDSYLLGALDPAWRLPPLAAAGDWLRTPFLVHRLREAPEVLVAYFPGGSQGGTLGSAEQPHPWLLQYGVALRLAEPRWLHSPPFTFARYEQVQSRAVRLEPQRFTPWVTGAQLTVHFSQPLRQGLLLLSTGTPPGGMDVEAPGAAEARLEALPGLWLLHLRAGEAPLRKVTLRVREGLDTEQRWFHGAALVSAH